MRPRQIARVLRRHAIDLMRDKRTLFALVTVPVLTVILMVAVRDELIGSISGGAKIRQPVAVAGARHAAAFIDDLRAFANVEIIETDDVHQAVRDERALIGLIIPKGFTSHIRRGTQARLRIVQSGRSSVRTSIAEATVQGAIDGYARRIVAQRLRAAGLPRTTAQPIKLEPESVATEEERSGHLLGEFLPFLVMAQVVALMSGTAVDVTAGEKERRTIEALVATPLRRREILIGKWLFTAAIGALGATLTVAAALVSFRAFTSSLLGADISLLPPEAVATLILGGMATAIVVSSIQMVIGIFARSTQQAAAMASPLFFVVFIPLFFLEGTSGTTVPLIRYAIPAFGPAMLTRYGLSGTATAWAMPVAVGTSIVYALAVLALADRLFRSERALLRV